MLAGTYNITCEQGSTFSLIITVQYPDTVDPSVYYPWDFSDYTARMQIRRTLESSTPMIELTTENGRLEFSNPTEGEIRIHMTAEETAALTTSGVYDLEIVNAASEVSKVIKGAFNLLPEVTR